jgi:hypothetical protein
VSSYAIDDGERLLFFDPLAVPDELLALAPEREPVVVLTAPWHERDTQALVGRLARRLRGRSRAERVVARRRHPPAGRRKTALERALCLYG